MKELNERSIKRFMAKLEKCYKRSSGRDVALDTMAVRKLVRKNRETATYVVKSLCILGKNDHALFQSAAIVASACYVEFNDSAVMEMVREHAKAVGAEEVLKLVGFL
jgi:hypothetical protein